MKKTMKNAAIGLFTLLAVTTGFTASAIGYVQEAELKIAGQQNNHPVFQLNINNSLNKRYLIIIKDEFGTVLHEEIATGINISRKFQFNYELDGIDVCIEIRDLKNDALVMFNITNRSKTVSETAIVKG